MGGDIANANVSCVSDLLSSTWYWIIHWAKYGVKELWTICYHPGVPQFISQSFDLFLEDEPYSTSYRGNTKKHITMHLHTSDEKKLKKKEIQ